MEDDEFERRLRGFRPAGPPADLRARCLDAGALPAGRAWPWAAAAAVMLATAIGLHAGAARAAADAGVNPGPDAPAHERAALTDALGGGPDAERLADLIVSEQQLARVPERLSNPFLEPQ